MSDVIIQLNNLADWTFRTSKTKVATLVVEDNKEKYIPIPDFDLGFTTNAKFFAVSVLINYGRPTWKHGGYLNQVYPFSLNTQASPIGKTIAESRLLLINRTINTVIIYAKPVVIINYVSAV